MPLTIQFFSRAAEQVVSDGFYYAIGYKNNANPGWRFASAEVHESAVIQMSRHIYTDTEKGFAYMAEDIISRAGVRKVPYVVAHVGLHERINYLVRENTSLVIPDLSVINDKVLVPEGLLKAVIDG